MNTVKFSVCLLFLLAREFCLPRTGPAQVFRHFSDNEGAPQSFIYSISQDSLGFMWYASTGGLFRYNASTFKVFKHVPGDAASLPSTYATAVFCDSRGTLWVCSLGGLSKYDSKNETFQTYKPDEKVAGSIGTNEVNCVAEDKQKNIWVGTMKGLKRVETKNGQTSFIHFLQTRPGEPRYVVRDITTGVKNELWLATSRGLVMLDGDTQKVFTVRPDPRLPATNNFARIYNDHSGYLWLGLKTGGLMRFNISTHEFRLIDSFTDPNGGWPVVSSFTPGKNGRMWIATLSGLVNFDKNKPESQWYVNDPADDRSLANNSILSMFEDREGGLWLGTTNSGIDYLNLASPVFSRWPFNLQYTAEGRFSGGLMGLTPDQRPWLMTQDKKQVILYDKAANKTVGYGLDAGFVKNIDHFFIDERDVIWCAENTLLRSYDLKKGVRKDYPFPSRLVIPNGRSRVLCMIQDRPGRLWIGGGPGLLRFDKQTAAFHDTGVQAVLGSLLEDSKGNIWGGEDNQVWLIRNGTGQAEKIVLNQTVSPEIAGYAFVWRMTEDPAGRIWLATLQGVRLYDPGTRRFELYPDDDKRLTGDDIQSDPNGYLWISNGNRLLRFHPDKKTLQSYSSKDGLPKNALLLLNATVIDRAGTLFFNTTREMFSVNTHQVSTNDKQAPLVISSLKLFNKVVRANDETGILAQDVSRVKELVFRHDQNIFSLDFALLNFARSHQNKYRYRLDGFDKEWNEPQVPSATYMNLPPGTYTFFVEAANGDGYRNSNPLQLKITVRPPWWKTWYAYLSYLLLTALIVYAVTRFFWLRSSFRKENALNQAKLDFFTNVSHEIRTHLSLISGPLERVYEQFKTGKNIENTLNYARNNSDRLMLLVNELLDFRKIQSGSVRLQVQAYDVVKIIKSVLSAFEHLAKEKDIETVLACPETPVVLWFDVAQMQKVFYNLLSNAYKFTPDGGKVTVRLAETPEGVQLSVEDNGKGIAKEYLAQLFTYYYQADSEKPGYGIGLALSKKIVEQHRGRLTAESRPASGPIPGSTVLTVHLLRHQQHFSPDEIKSNGDGEVAPFLTETPGVISTGMTVQAQAGNTILVIEDNDELRAFIGELLGGKFNILEASNGLLGLELAREHIPDLVLCDVMMPGMNGLEVCSQLKNTTATAHIPVVLLTARTQNEQVIEGLATGADDYLTKPFDPRILELKINNAIRVRDNLMERYRQSLFQEQESGATLAQDLNQVFVVRLKTLVAENISDPNFGVNELAREIGMSVSALYRKLRSLTGMTVNEFVKSIRFNEARKLVESGVYLVSEVATMVGFEDTRYFSREFKKMFGKNPNEIRNPTTG